MKRKCEQLEASLALVHQRDREKKSGAEKRCREMVNIIQGQKEYIDKLERQLMNQSTVGKYVCKGLGLGVGSGWGWG
jgi:hypothetical protein